MEDVQFTILPPAAIIDGMPAMTSSGQPSSGPSVPWSGSDGVACLTGGRIVGAIALPLGGDEHAWDALAPLEDVAQELLGRFLVPPTLHENIATCMAHRVDAQHVDKAQYKRQRIIEADGELAIHAKICAGRA